jgi:hypothetical protein
MDRSRRLFIGASIAAAGSASAAASLSSDHSDQPINVRDYGAVGDGSTDDHRAFAAAVSAGRGRRIWIPKGNYRINADAGSITLEEVDLVGEGVLDGATGSIDRGANLWITGTRYSPFKVRRGTSVMGLGIFYPGQRDSPAPQPYPPTFTFDFTNGAVQFVNFLRVVVYNAWEFIEIDDAGGNVGHVEITGNYICALRRGIYLRRNTEHLRIERNNFTFSHWLQGTEAGIRGYMRANAVAVQADESDGLEFVDNLIFGYLTGLLTSAIGLCQSLKISDNKFDQVRFGVRANGSGNFDGQIVGNTFTSLNAQDRALEARSISIQTNGPKLETITVASNNFNVSCNEHIYVEGDVPTRKIVCGPNNFRAWASGKQTGTFGAVHTSGVKTDVQITGGWFYSTNPARSVGLTGVLDTLQLTGAMFEACVAAVQIDARQVVASTNCSKSTLGPVSDVIAAPKILQYSNAWDKPSRPT